MEKWSEQISGFVNTVAGLKQFINLTPEEQSAIEETKTRWGTTPYFAGLMDPNDPLCPIRKQVIPSPKGESTSIPNVPG